MGFFNVFVDTKPSTEMAPPKLTLVVTPVKPVEPVNPVSTVSTKKRSVEIKDKIRANQLLVKCYTPSGGLLLVKAKSAEHKKWMEEVNPKQ
jgi:hypothetical protein